MLRALLRQESGFQFESFRMGPACHQCLGLLGRRNAALSIGQASMFVSHKQTHRFFSGSQKCSRENRKHSEDIKIAARRAADPEAVARGVAAKRFVNVSLGGVITRINITDLEDLGELQDAVKRRFGDSVPTNAASIQLWAGDSWIAKWTQFNSLPIEYFTVDGPCLIIRTTLSPPMDATNAELEYAGPASVKQRTDGPKPTIESLHDIEDARLAVKRAGAAVWKAEEDAQSALDALAKWKTMNPEFSGGEPQFKILKQEVDSARAAVDSARAAVDSARAYYLKLNGSQSNTLLPRPQSVPPDKWPRLVTTQVLEKPDSQFFHSLLNDRVVEVNSIKELPISQPRIGCITSYTDPVTKVQVICLPHPFSQSSIIGSHVVFIRPFNIAMMEAMIKCASHNIILVGNAGIGKSYMQLMILLWWARKDLRPLGVDWDGFMENIHAVVRVEIGQQTDLFFKRDSLHYFIDYSYSSPKLSALNSKSTLLLYEPSVSKDEIRHSGIISGRVWATVSPLRSRYKEFSKYSATKYMECPNEEELLFMASVMDCGLDASSPLKDLYKRDSVLERIRSIGPFLRPVLPDNQNVVTGEKTNQEGALSNLQPIDLLKAWNISNDISSGIPSMSHYVLRISPIMDGLFDTYTLKAANNNVTEKLGDLLFETDVKDLRTQLAIYDQNPAKASPAAKGTIPTVLETFFVKHAIQNESNRWMNWTVATCKFSSGSPEVEWKPFSLNVTGKNTSKNPTYADIVASPSQIFHMNDSTYPFVDYFWYDPVTKTVNAGQASKSFTGHPKSVDTCRKMLENLNMPTGEKIVINMIPLPSQAVGYAFGTTSKFFTNVGSDAEKIKRICEQVEFRVIKMVLI